MKIFLQYLISLFILGILLLTSRCAESGLQNGKLTATEIASEKAAILKVLNDETAAAFNRNYEGWKKNWIQADYVTKSYMNFSDSTLEETLGWKKVDDFVRTYIEEHPEPDPLPDKLTDIEVRLYGNGAWVEYEQEDPVLGMKRESRLMEKQNDQWKIAGMQTVIYGFENEQK